jgi:cation:H+ antiporter
MPLAFLAVLSGLALLVWSADRFVDGAAAAARHFGMPPLLIGMVILGFGTSAPEMVVSALAATQGNPGLALGNAYGSNITNIALILGITALIAPITVHSKILRKELPLLAAITGLSAFQIADGHISLMDAWVLLAIFGGLMAWTIRQGLQHRNDTLGRELERGIPSDAQPISQSLLRLITGLVFLVIASRTLVWGAVSLARGFGVNDLIIGLTIVAVGTSLPELASSIIATRKGEHDIALGNVIGSNLFNTLAVVGIAGAIHPMDVAREVLTRDALTMGFLTLSLFIIGYGFRGAGRINRFEGVVLIAAYIGYNAWIVMGIV